jgi:hypothetical protein
MWMWSRIIRSQESLALYKSFDTLFAITLVSLCLYETNQSYTVCTPYHFPMPELEVKNVDTLFHYAEIIKSSRWLQQDLTANFGKNVLNLLQLII